MILNDRAIRALCLVPTHQLVSHGNFTERHLYTRIGTDLYSTDTGHRHEFKDYEQFKLEPLTPEQQRGYAAGGGFVPDTTVDNVDGERGQLLTWGRMIYPFEPGQVRDRITVTHKDHPNWEQHKRLKAIDGGFPLEEDGDTIKEKIISYGTSSMGYDVRLGRKFKIFTNVNGAVIDPLAMSEHSYVDREGDFVLIPPNSYVLGHTIEYFRMPEDVVAICVGKSTYARAGCAINVTPIEPGFEGQVVIEIANQTPLPMKVYADMGIAQFMFFKGDSCEISYAKRAGKYQGQLGITTARV
jgi:dCTP deaminase